MPKPTKIPGGDPNSDKQQAYRAMHQANMLLMELVTNWDTLTQAQRQEAMRQACIANTRASRYLLKERL